MSNEKKSEQELNRRHFLAAAAAAATACALCPGDAHAADEDDDDDDMDDAPPELPKGPQDAGPLSDYAKDGGFDNLAKSKHILLFRDKGKLYALSAICTHKRFLCKEKDAQFYCPKHASRFTHDGTPTTKTNGKPSPAKKPLEHYAIKLDDQTHVIVDTSKPVKAGDAGSFVPVK